MGTSIQILMALQRNKKDEKKHTVTSQRNLSSDSNKRSKQRPKSGDYTSNLANRQKRTGLWRLCMGYNTKSFKKSTDREHLKTKPTHEDLMNEVDNQNCFAAAPDDQEKLVKNLLN